MSTRRGLVFLYLLLLSLYLMVFGRDLWAAITLPELLIAPVMALGSFVAGSTFLGGGAVAFPAMTKILATDADTAKNFSLAIQSVGMTSASLYILTRIKNLSFDFMGWYLCSAVLGMLICLLFMQGTFSSIDLRIGFTLFISCFLVIYLWTLHDQDGEAHTEIRIHHQDHLLIFLCGLAGGLLSGLLGSGADLFAFCLLSLYFRVDLKLATQMSVIIMASVSIVGIAAQWLFFDRVQPLVIELWYMAAPVVLLGAPLGAFFCRRLPNHFLVIFITLIVIIEVATTLLFVPIAPSRALYYGFALVVSCLFLLLLSKVNRPKTI